MNKVWKILKVLVIVVFCLILLGLIGGYIFLKNFDIRKYKTQIISTANQTLGRSVDFDDINLRVSMREGIRFNLKNLTISENPDFGKSDFAKVKEVSIGLDLLSFINARQVSVPNIFVESLEITVVRNASGQFNVQTLGSQKPENNSQDQQKSASSAAVLPAIFINSLRVEDARLNYIDQSVNPAFEAAVSQLNVRVDRFSLSSPFSFFVEGAVLSPQKNLKIDGNAQLNMIASQTKLFNVRIATDLGQFPLQELRRLPMLQGVPLPSVLEGKYNGTIKECVISDNGLDSLVLDSQLSSGKIVVKNVTSGISLDVSKVDLSVMDFSFGKPFHVVVKAAYMGETPNIDLQGDVSYDMTRQNVRLSNLTFATDLALWPLEKIKTEVDPLKYLPVPQKLVGKFQITIKELSAGPKGLDSALLDAQLQEAEVSFKEVALGISFDASKINFALRNFSLNAPFQISLQMAYLNDAQNIGLDGTASYNLKTQEVRLKDAKVSVDMDAISLQQLKSSVAMLKDVPFPEILGGKLEATIKNLSAGAQGLKSVLLDAHLNQGKVSMKDVAPGVSFKANQIDVDVRNFSLSDPFGVSAKLAYLADAQNISFDGTVAYNMQTREVRLKESKLAVDLAKLNFQELRSSVAAVKDVPLPETLSGDLNFSIKDLSVGAKGLNSVAMDADLKNGAVNFKNITPGVSLAVSQIGLELKNVSLGQPITFHLNAAYLNASPNIDLAGTAIVDPTQQSVQLKDTKLKTDLSSFSMDELRVSMASLKDVPFPQSLKGQLNIVLEEATAGAKGLVSLTSHGELTQGFVKLKELAVPIDVNRAEFKTAGTNANVDDFSISIGKGTVKGKLSIDEFLTKQSFDVEAIVDGIDLVEVVEQKDAPVKVEGKVFANIKAQGQGSDVNSIVGDGTMELKDGKFKDLNILKAVFDSIKIPFLPNLSMFNLVMKILPEDYKKLFENKDTDLQNLKLAMNISEGSMHIDPIDVQSDVFAFVGKGEAGFDQAYAFDGGFKLSRELSDLLVRDAEQPFASMVDENNVVSFPVHVNGKGSQLPVFKAVTTFKDITKNAVMSKGKEELGKVLNKIFDKSGDTSGQPQEPQQSPQGDSSAEGSQKSPEQQIIDGIFGTIFK